MKRFFATLLCAVLLLSTVCAVAEDKVQLRFSWWGGDERHEATLATMAAYEAKNPGVKLVGEYSGFDGYLEKLVTQLAGGTAPDIIQIDYAYLETLWSVSDNFVNFADQEIVDISGMSPSLLAGVTSPKGLVIGLPTGLNFSIIYVNKTLADAAGIELGHWTWDDLFANAKKLREYNPDAYLVIGGTNPNRSLFEPYLLNLSGQKLVNNDYTLGFTVEQAAEAFKFIKRCYDEGVLFPLEDEAVGTYGNYQAYDWLNGNILCLPDYSSGESAAKGSMDNVVAMPFWGDSEADNTGIMMRPTNMIAVNAKSANVEEALKFVNYFFNDPEAIDTLKLVRSIPSTNLAISRMNEQGLVAADTMEAANWAAEHKGGAGQNIISTNEELERIEGDFISSVYYDEYTPEEAAEAFVEAMQDCVNELKATALKDAK